jgi:urea carboxylase-associated protein 1
MSLDFATAPGTVICEETVAAGMPWSRRIEAGEVLRIVDLEGQQAVDFLCYRADDLEDRYSATNTIKVQGSVYVGNRTVLYSDAGLALMTVIEDTFGRHDTIYGCCSEANNFLRYGVSGSPSCYANFLAALQPHGLGRSAIVGNVNFFMQVPVLESGAAAVVPALSPPGSYVDLRAECATLAVLSNCPQIHNPCNGYKPTPIRTIVYKTASN